MSSWMKVEADVHQDETLEEIAMNGHGSRVLAYWLVLMAESKLQHRTNEGWSRPFTLTSFAAAAFDESTSRAKVKALLAEFVNQGLLEVKGELTRRWRARPVNFMRKQERASAAERQEKRRSVLQDFSAQRHTSVTPESQQSHTDVTQPSYVRAKTETETYTSKPQDVVSAQIPDAAPGEDPYLHHLKIMRPEIEAFADGEAVQMLSDQIWYARRSQKFDQHPLEKWVWAVRAFRTALAEGRIDDPGKAVGWIRRAVPTAGPPLKVRGDALPVSEADRRRVELEELAAKYGGGAA